MRSVEAVLLEKEGELQCVRRQVEALRMVIPLLRETPEDFSTPDSTAPLGSVQPSKGPRTLSDLETYFPFVRKLRANGANDLR